MKILNSHIIFILIGCLVFSCKRKTEEELCEVVLDEPYHLVIPQGLTPPTIPVDNPITKYKVKIGERMFFDKELSSTGLISCASCHIPSRAFSDTVPISVGVHNRRGLRNSPSIVNMAYKQAFFMDGGSPTLEQQVMGPITSHEEMDMDFLDAIEHLKNDAQYVQWSNIAFGRDPDAYVFTRSIAAYQRTLISGTSKYDNVKNETATYTTEEQRGEAVFLGKGKCGTCHSGQMFTNYSYQNIGLYASYSDSGRARITLNSNDNGKFMVPSLRNIVLTGPYMHDGSIQTLEQVIDFFNQGGVNHPNKSNNVQPLMLTQQEKNDLVAFLHTLTDDNFIANYEN